MGTAHIPARSFTGSTSNTTAAGTATIDQINNDQDEQNIMMNPDGVHANGDRGGVHKDNLMTDSEGNNDSGIITEDNIGEQNVAEADNVTTNINGHAITDIFETDGVTAKNASNGCPAGAVLSFARNTPPPGWLECNGAEVSRSMYENLFLAIGITWGAGDGSTTFKLPDLRGEFARGWDHGRGVDSGRVFASSQSELIKNHIHSITTFKNIILTNTMGIQNGSNFPWMFGGSTDINTTGNPQSEAGVETRPRNVALLFCIKY
jgi:microcystin-dependent protein